VIGAVTVINVCFSPPIFFEDARIDGLNADGHTPYRLRSLPGPQARALPGRALANARFRTATGMALGVRWVVGAPLLCSCPTGRAAFRDCHRAGTTAAVARPASDGVADAGACGSPARLHQRYRFRWRSLPCSARRTEPDLMIDCRRRALFGVGIDVRHRAALLIAQSEYNARCRTRGAASSRCLSQGAYAFRSRRRSGCCAGRGTGQF
jgi:hypothetical protein